MKRIGFALTSSFCTINKVLDQMEALVQAGYDVIPIASPAVIECNTRFGEGNFFKEKIEFITGHKIVTSIVEAERFGPKEPLDLLLIAPATGNFIAKLANGITDNVVTMAAKATLRNQKPLVIGVSTNDGLGLNSKNIMHLLNQKGIYFIPFGQDDYENKPNSLIAHYDLTLETIEKAFDNIQYQPVLKEHQKIKTK
jgi:dipicolinate synthase subunit B